jgi:hypothetical protein
MMLADFRKSVRREGRALPLLLAMMLAYGLGSAQNSCLGYLIDIYIGGAE